MEETAMAFTVVDFDASSYDTLLSGVTITSQCCFTSEG